jgi:transposase
MARQTILNDEIMEALEATFRLGQTSIKQACDWVGIGEATYHQWMAKGRDGREPYTEFVERMDKARARAVLDNLAIIRTAAQNGQWQAAAWFLERAYPQQWGRRTTVEVITVDMIQAEITRLEQEVAAAELGTGE